MKCRDSNCIKLFQTHTFVAVVVLSSHLNAYRPLVENKPMH